MWKPLSIACGCAAALLAGTAGGADTPAQTIANVKHALESICGEFSGRDVSYGEFFGPSGRKRQSYRYADIQVVNNVMHWKKYIATRSHGSNGPHGDGNVFYYSVVLTDLIPDPIQIEHIRINNENTGVFAVDLKCQNGSACIGQNAHSLTPASRTRHGVQAPVDHWMEGGVTPKRVRDVRLHVCDLAGSGRSRNVAEALRYDMRRLIDHARSGAVINAGGVLPGHYYAPPAYGVPAPYGQPGAYGMPPAAPQPYYPPRSY